jgi:preprotein translocase subunit SecD
MFGTTKGRLLVVIVVTLASLALLITKPVKLGLDLRGGTLLAMEIDDPTGKMSPDLKSAAIDQNIEVLRNRLDKFGVAETPVQKVGKERIIVQLPGIEDPERAKRNMQKAAVLEFVKGRPSSEFEAAKSRIDRAVAEALKSGAVHPIAAAADTGTADTAAAKTDAANQKSVQDLLFGNKDTTKAAGDSAKADTSQVAATDAAFSKYLLPFGEGEYLVKMTDKPTVETIIDSVPALKQALPRGSQLLFGNDTIAQNSDLYVPLYFLDEDAFLNGQELTKSTAGRDPQFNKTVVNFELTRKGGRKFGEVTQQWIGKRIAIVLDNKVFSAPVVNGRIDTNGQIDMNQSPIEDARDLSLILNAGAFSAPLKIVEERTVSASLGADSVRQGFWAGILGLALVVFIMIFVYRFSGLLSIIALVIYVLVVLAGLGALGAALTAPGIAGLILSIGMALDSNILIFERIREELLHGRPIRLASEEGFKHAMAAVIDTHLTTLITAFILYKVGTGPVQGFAVTLAVGLLASFFSAVFVTRTFFLMYLERNRAATTISI